MVTTFSTQSFKTAKENMDFDQAIQEADLPQETIIRLYEWQVPGITYSYKQDLPYNLSKYDHSRRLTGGGIVFHSPGDLVLSIRGSNPGKRQLKEKMGIVTEAATHAFKHIGITLTNQETDSSVNRDFCTAYPNPFERYVDDQKVLALTLRNYRKHYMIQGIVHLQSNTRYFDDIDPAYAPFLTQGLEGKRLDMTTLKLALFQEIAKGENHGTAHTL